MPWRFFVSRDGLADKVDTQSGYSGQEKSLV